MKLFKSSCKYFKPHQTKIGLKLKISVILEVQKSETFQGSYQELFLDFSTFSKVSPNKLSPNKLYEMFLAFRSFFILNSSNNLKKYANRIFQEITYIFPNFFKPG